VEAKLNELVKRLSDAAADNLKAVVLYGSAVSGDYYPKHSDLNIFCLVERAGVAELEQLHSPAKWWMRQGNPAPLIFTFAEMKRSADIFAIEFLDMKRHHRMLYGEEFLDSFDIPMGLHRMQTERELRTNWVRLRRAILAAPRKRKNDLAIMLSSVSAFCVLFGHAVIALGGTAPANKREAVDGAASLAGADASVFHAILDLREGRRKEKDIDAEAALEKYMAFVEAVTGEVDRRLETK